MTSATRTGLADRRGVAPVAYGLTTLSAAIVIAGCIWPGNPTDRLPSAWQFDLMKPTSAVVRYVSNDLSVGGVSLSEITRALARLLEWPLLLIQSVLAVPFEADLPGLGPTEVPPLPWSVVVVGAAALAYRVGGVRLMLLTVSALVYFAVFGLWTSAMLTLSAVIVSVAAGIALGLFLGVLAFRHRRFEAVLQPIYDTLQTLPVFSYLVPLVVFFGLGPVTSLVATVVYATPPMARITTLALRTAPSTLGELARMSGCSPSAEIWRVLLPSRLRDLLVGVNQVIMLSLATVVIAATIGAGGLGNDVLRALKSLRFGAALEAGLAITLMAVTLDRASRAMAARRPDHRRHDPSDAGRRRLRLAAALGLVGILYAFGMVVPELGAFPSEWTITSADLLGDAVQEFNRTHAAGITALRDWMTVTVMRPVRDLLAAAPWLGVVTLVAAVATAVSGGRSAAIMAALLCGLSVAGLWQHAVLSFYLVALGSLIVVLIGAPIGILAALVPRIGHAVDLLVDTLQTLPAFVYLVPSVVLFSVGELPALLSITLYAVAPAIRYVHHGLGATEATVLEAAKMAGATRLQTLVRVQLPLAMPHVLLGVSQTIMMAFSMLAITALVGSRGLEILTLEALGKVDPGKGLVAGLGIVVLSVVADRLVSGAAARLSTHGRRSRG